MRWRRLKPRRETDLIVLHCSATPPGMRVNAEKIDEWHRAQHWIGIGYHWVVNRSGGCEAGRPQDLIGSHARRFNHRSVGVCWVGGVGPDKKTPEDNRTKPQKRALKALLNGLLAEYPEAGVIGHGELPGHAKACPSFDVRAWLEKIGLGERYALNLVTRA